VFELDVILEKHQATKMGVGTSFPSTAAEFLAASQRQFPALAVETDLNRH
jgi:hypothetical protein